ncbi:hypothetical protein [Nocardia sp. NPDC046763]|uniref:hypothetical protein n=1 Tax=Nocardia sp. NPDC046763 TaxID=3155256 RepID=UPI0033CEB540
MALEPIEPEFTLPNVNKGVSDEVALWLDPNSFPVAVNGIVTAYDEMLSIALEDAPGFPSTEFGDIDYRVKDYHERMNNGRAVCAQKCQELAMSLSNSLKGYQVADEFGKTTISATGG